VRRAKALARGRLRGGKAVLYTVDTPFGISTAQIVRRNLARIGLRADIKAFPFPVLFAKLFAPGEPFDIAGFCCGLQRSGAELDLAAVCLKQ
jgi:hypothetical protein